MKSFHRINNRALTKVNIFFSGILIFGLCCCYLVPISLSATMTTDSISLSAVDDDIRQEPPYSILYNRLLSLEKEGKPLEALKMVPEIYTVEIPVDSFLYTLENKRLQLLDAIAREGISFMIGNETYTTSDLLRIFRNRYLGQVEFYHQIYNINSDLDFKRFCYFMIINGQYQKGSLFQFDIKKILKNNDPWLIAGALYLSRKQKAAAITPQDIIDRWQIRPDLWDEECTRQSLFYLAQYNSMVIKTLIISNEDIRLQVKRLRPVVKHQGYITPLMYSATGTTVSYFNTFTGTIVRLRRDKDNSGAVKQGPGDAVQYSPMEPLREKKIKGRKVQEGTIPVEPGFYKLRFNSVNGSPPSGFYGDSAVVEVNAGEHVVFPIGLVPAI